MLNTPTLIGFLLSSGDYLLNYYSNTMPNIILNEEAQSQVQEVLNSLPINELPKVQKLVAIFNANVEKPSAEVVE